MCLSRSDDGLASLPPSAAMLGAGGSLKRRDSMVISRLKVNKNSNYLAYFLSCFAVVVEERYDPPEFLSSLKSFADKLLLSRTVMLAYNSLLFIGTTLLYSIMGNYKAQTANVPLAIIIGASAIIFTIGSLYGVVTLGRALKIEKSDYDVLRRFFVGNSHRLYSFLRGSREGLQGSRGRVSIYQYVALSSVGLTRLFSWIRHRGRSDGDGGQVHTTKWYESQQDQGGEAERLLEAKATALNVVKTDDPLPTRSHSRPFAGTSSRVVAFDSDSDEEMGKDSAPAPTPIVAKHKASHFQAANFAEQKPEIEVALTQKQSMAGSVVEAKAAEEENRKQVEATEQKQRRVEVEAMAEANAKRLAAAQAAERILAAEAIAAAAEAAKQEQRAVCWHEEVQQEEKQPTQPAPTPQLSEPTQPTLPPRRPLQRQQTVREKQAAEASLEEEHLDLMAVFEDAGEDTQSPFDASPSFSRSVKTALDIAKQVKSLRSAKYAAAGLEHHNLDDHEVENDDDFEDLAL